MRPAMDQSVSTHYTLMTYYSNDRAAGGRTSESLPLRVYSSVWQIPDRIIHQSQKACPRFVAEYREDLPVCKI